MSAQSAAYPGTTLAPKCSAYTGALNDSVQAIHVPSVMPTAHPASKAHRWSQRV